MSEDKQNWKSKQYPSKQQTKEDTKYHRSYKYPKKEEQYQKIAQKIVPNEHLLQLIQDYPNCFSTKKIEQAVNPNIPIDECLLKISKLEQKPQRKKSETSKLPIYQEQKKFEKYYKKEAYETKAHQDDEPEWMNSNMIFPDLNDFQQNTLQYDFKKVLNLKNNLSERLKNQTPEELFADVDEILEQKFKDVSEKTITPKQQLSENSSDNEINFDQLLEKSQKRNSTEAPKIESKRLESHSIYPILEQKCSQIYSTQKEYNKIKLFIDFTRQMTKLDINDNTWYYEDPQKKIQGPFSSVDMDVWNLDQYFPPILQISWKQQKSFISIQQFKYQPIQVIKLAFIQDEAIVDLLQIDQQEIKKPQGFENYNKNQEQVSNVQIFSIPNYQITHNNFQISQNNFQMPFFTGEPQYKNSENYQQKFNLNSLNNSTELQNIVKNSQPSAQQSQNTMSSTLAGFTQMQNQKTQTQPYLGKKSVDVQTQPQLLSDLQVIKDVKANKFENISELDLKKLLGIEKGSSFFNFS